LSVVNFFSEKKGEKQVATNHWTKSTLERYLKEGRGQGTGADYKPWRNTYEFSSKGRVTRIYGNTTRRIHQLHSDNQYRAFLIFEFQSRVTDIRESYPQLKDIGKGLHTILQCIV
jgi:hypothetical protein